MEVVIQGSRLEIGGPTQRALLAVLLLEANEVVPTDTIVQALWGDKVPRSAVGVIRTYVWRLRQILNAGAGDVSLVSRSPGYVLEVDPHRIDAHEFRRLALDGRNLLDSGRLTDALGTLDRALALWRGDVLADLNGFEGFRQALVPLDQLRQTALEDRVETKLALGQHAQIVDELGVLIQEQPYRERRWGQLMLALYRSGRQTEALGMYQRVRSVLVEEIGVEPGPDLRALERRILDHDDSLSWRMPVPDHAFVGPAPQAGIEAAPGRGALSAEPLFVGRVAEQALVSRCIDRARHGEFSAVLIAGAPGIGKSALARQAVHTAREAGMTVLSGRFDEDASVPFRPFSAVIGQWSARASADDLDRLGRRTLDQLSRIVPALVKNKTEIAPPSLLGEHDRLALFEAIAQWIGTAGSTAPTLIVLDDLQWADAPSLLALRHVLRHPPATSAVVIALYRDTEVDSDGRLADLLAVARREADVHHVRLTGLGDHEIEHLLRSWAGGRDLDDTGVAFAKTLNQAAGGNPLFIVETVRHLIEHDAIAPEAGRWSAEPLDAFGVPSAISDVITSRLDRLPASSRSLLETASVLGEHFELTVLSRMTSMSTLTAVDTLEPAIAAQVVIPSGPFGTRYQFAHALVRHAILDKLRPSHRTRLHWQAGEVIRDLHAADLGPHRAEIAHHLAAGVLAGDPQVAIEANVHAGESALDALAFEEAYERFTTATGLIRSAGIQDERLAYGAWMGVASAGRGESREAFQRAATIARENGWHDLLARAAIGFTARSAGDPRVHAARPTAIALVHEAVDALRTSPPSIDHCMLLAVMTARAIADEDIARAREFADETQQLARCIDDDAAQAAAACARGYTLLGSPHQHELAQAIEHGMQPLPDPGHRLRLRFFMLALLPAPAMSLGDRAGFLAARNRVLTLPETRDMRWPATLESFWAGAHALAAGRLDDFTQIQHNRPDELANQMEAAILQRALAVAHSTPPSKLVEPMSLHVSSTPRAVNGRAWLALLHAEVGDRGGAAREVDSLIHHRRLDERDWGAPFVFRYLSEAIARAGLRHVAEQLLPILSPYAGQMLVSYGGASIDAAADRAIGQLLLTLDQVDAAIEHLVAAEQLERSFGADALAVRSRYWHAKALAQRNATGDGDRARTLLQRVAHDARQLGMEPLADDAAGGCHLGP
jgi:DNA-binding SARP family transcriptional activator